jgi:5-methylcytosine-specific restriction enzyme subunit McrC
MRYNPSFNPLKRQSPTPRPDFVVINRGKLYAILDAKYRDLWEKNLPREMLYQLVVYAISHRQCPQSSILYPTLETSAKEARIDITDPIFGNFLGQVCLRPIHLPTILELITTKTTQGRREREVFAKQLAFGETSNCQGSS